MNIISISIFFEGSYATKYSDVNARGIAEFGIATGFAQGIADKLVAGSSPDVRLASVTYSGPWYV